MTESKSNKLPQFNFTEELVEFFETHDLGEYEIPEAHFDVYIKRDHYLISVEENLMNGLLEMAKKQQVSVEILVNSLLKEELGKAG